MASPVLQVKRGSFANLPALRAGEPAFTTDTFDFYVGIDSTTNNNKFLGSNRYWTKETTTVGSSVKLVEGTNNGSNFVAFKAPNSLAGDVTYVLPGTQGGSSTVLTNDGSGNLSWSSGSFNATFTGITTFSDTTDSTSKDNGSVILEGGIGIEKSVNIGGNLKVTGVSTFTGAINANGGVVGNLTGTATNATYINISAQTTDDNTYYVPFEAGMGNTSLYVDTALYYNPGQNRLTTTNISATEFDSTNIKATGITTTGTLKLSGTSNIGITGISSSTTLAENSHNYLPTQAAVKAYVDAVDVTTGIAGDTGTGTVSTSQTLTVAGTANEIETSASNQTITVGLPNSVSVTTALTVPTVKATNLQANDGTTAITITNTTGAVGFANSVTISGDLYVLGNTTEVNTTSLKVEDTLVDLGLINSGGVLVAPTSDLNLDLGIIFNWFSGTAKKASVFWDDSAQRIAIASEVSESSGVLSVSGWASVEIGALWVNDCAGQSQVISCSGTERSLINITVDAGTF